MSAPPPDELVRATLTAERPLTVGELWKLVEARYDLDEDSFVETLKSMEAKGVLTFRKPKYRFETFLDYLFSLTVTDWLWTSFSMVLLAVLAVATIPPSSPFAPIRWGLGSLFVLYLPGYALLRLLFPVGSNLDSIERFALAFGLSLAIVPLVGLVLNYTPWGIRFEPIVASLALFTLCSELVAAVREYLRASGS